MERQIKILVVEDDNDINQLICSVAARSGYFPQPAFSGTEAMIYLQQQEWDLVLLDLMLPGMAGEEVLEKVSSDLSVPVMVISAKGEQHTKVDALRAGADDFMTKPFDIEELSARIDSLLRRYRRTGQAIPVRELKHLDIVMDIESKTISAAGKELVLTAREYAILELLLSSPKKVFTKANLFESVWNEQFLGDDNTLNVHISNLRSKLSQANPDQEYIETVWGVGYRLKT